jgi:hypothetical protein
MTRKEAERLTRQMDTLRSLGFTSEEAEALRRISMTLHRWHELECGTDSGCIERDEQTGKPWLCTHPHNGKVYRRRIADKERGAQRRLLDIINAEAKRHGECRYSAYIQTDPRGAALYIIRPGDVPAGEDVSAYYNRGICVY